MERIKRVVKVLARREVELASRDFGLVSEAENEFSAIVALTLACVSTSHSAPTLGKVHTQHEVGEFAPRCELILYHEFEFPLFGDM